MQLSCAHCQRPSTKTCNKCHQVFYCSRQCQNGHHKIHKKTCASLAQAWASQQAQRETEEERQCTEAATWQGEEEDEGEGAGRCDEWVRGRVGFVRGYVREFATDAEMRAWVREASDVEEEEGKEVEDREDE